MSMRRTVGRWTMYRSVTLALGLIALSALLFAGLGVLTAPLTLGGLALSLVQCLVVSFAANEALARIVRLRPHRESSLITALIMFLLFWPPSTLQGHAWLTLALLLANASKYVLVWRGRHVLNPAAAGAVLVALVQWIAGVEPFDRLLTTWWVANESLLPIVAVTAALVLYRTHRLIAGGLLVVVAGIAVSVSLIGLGSGVVDAGRSAFVSYPIVFAAGFMFSEPLTLPPRRSQQCLVATVIGLLLAWPVGTAALGWPALLPFSVTPEVAIIVGNAVAFVFHRRAGITLEVIGRRQVTPSTHELAFRPQRRVTWHPGQYIELTVPHIGVDGRGTRRMLSIASAAGDGIVRIATRHSARSSSFKRALIEVREGEIVSATGIWGDFLLPSDASAPVLAVAGGIGITPFLAQARELAVRDAVLVYGARSADEAAYLSDVAETGVRGVLVCPDRPGDLPEGWSHVAAVDLTAQVIRDAVPDAAARHAYVAGPPAMVAAVSKGLKGSVRTIRTDAFSGY